MGSPLKSLDHLSMHFNGCYSPNGEAYRKCSNDFKNSFILSFVSFNKFRTNGREDWTQCLLLNVVEGSGRTGKKLITYGVPTKILRLCGVKRKNWTQCLLMNVKKYEIFNDTLISLFLFFGLLLDPFVLNLLKEANDNNFLKQNIWIYAINTIPTAIVTKPCYSLLFMCVFWLIKKKINH